MWCGNRWGLTGTYTLCHTWEPTFPCNYAKGMHKNLEPLLTYILVLMNVHILNEVLEQKWGDWDTYTVPYRSTQLSIKLCIGSGADRGSQVDINSCTDACIHSSQGMCPEVGWLWQTHNATQRYPCFHQTVHRVWSRHGQSGGHKFMYWCMYTFQPRCVPQAGWLGHSHSNTWGQPHFHVTIHRGLS